MKQRKNMRISRKSVDEEEKRMLVEGEIRSVRIEIDNIKMQYLEMCNTTSSVVKMIIPIAPFLIFLPFMLCYRK